jgi:hypothetical protein
MKRATELARGGSPLARIDGVTPPRRVPSGNPFFTTGENERLSKLGVLTPSNSPSAPGDATHNTTPKTHNPATTTTTKRSSRPF